MEGQVQERRVFKAHNAKVLVSSDTMAAFIELEIIPFPDEDEYDVLPVTEEELRQTLAHYKIVYGLDEKRIRSLVEQPAWHTPIQVACGKPPVDGQDGSVDYYIKRDAEYRPDFGEEDIIDYMNLEYFQMARKNQLLCKVIKATPGVEGTNVYGQPVRAIDGLPPPSPRGKNTYFDDQEVFLKAERDGLIRFARHIIDINEVLHIPGNVDFSTGNIRFSGDVTIEGDVNPGFMVDATGNIRVKGMAEGAILRSGGDVYIARGINGSAAEPIRVGGNLQSGYIENASVEVGGDIVSDYIINSDIVCAGDITLSGSRELIIGGSTQLAGNLTAKYIGSERETPTKIVIRGTRVRNEELIASLTREISDHTERAAALKTILDKFTKDGSAGHEQLEVAKEQLFLLKRHILKATARLKEQEDNERIVYRGAVLCKKQKFRGAKIYFGDELFNHGTNEFDRCRIFYADGEINLGTL